MKYGVFLIVISIWLYTGCDTKKDLQPTPAVARIVGDDLKTWLESAPFENLWDPTKNGDGNYVITNVDQVFPFIGKYKNTTGSYKLTSPSHDFLYDKKTVVFKDPTYGESVFHGALFYDYEPLFLRSSMSEGSNIAFDGMNNLNQRYYASLQETKSAVITPSEKAILYWINSNNTLYLSGFYQKDQLALQFAFPFKDTVTSIQKIQEINKTMRLDISSWNSLTPSDLAINEEPISFWRDPFVGLYHEKFLPNLQLKLKDTDYTEIKKDKDGYDYAFAKAKFTSTIRIKTIPTALNNLDFTATMDDAGYEVIHTEYDDPVYLINDKKNSITAQTYFKNDQILEIHATIDVNDSNGRKELIEILEFIKIKKY